MSKKHIGLPAQTARAAVVATVLALSNVPIHVGAQGFFSSILAPKHGGVKMIVEVTRSTATQPSFSQIVENASRYGFARQRVWVGDATEVGIAGHHYRSLMSGTDIKAARAKMEHLADREVVAQLPESRVAGSDPVGAVLEPIVKMAREGRNDPFLTIVAICDLRPDTLPDGRVPADPLTFHFPADVANQPNLRVLIYGVADPGRFAYPKQTGGRVQVFGFDRLPVAADF